MTPPIPPTPPFRAVPRSVHAHPSLCLGVRRGQSARSIRGMTLVEVLAVVVILALLAGTLAVGFSGAFGKGKTELAKTGIGVLMERVELYRLETSEWPDAQAGLSVLSDGVASPDQSYYVGRDALLDPWDNEYVLIVPGPDGKPFEIVSYGADRAPGGEGEDADITSANLRGR